MKQVFMWKLKIFEDDTDHFLAVRVDGEHPMLIGMFHIDTLWKADWSVYDKLTKNKNIEVRVTFEDLHE